MGLLISHNNNTQQQNTL